jgi:hypothetical protein
MPFVKLSRAFPFGGVTYPVGAEIEVPDATADRMVASRPPFGVVIDDAELEALTEPSAPEFTSGALELLEENGLLSDEYAGDAEGKVTKADVREWLETRDS